MAYQATFNSSAITVASSHIHSATPSVTPSIQPVHGTSLFGFGWETTTSLILGVVAVSYSAIAMVLFLLNRKDAIPKEIILVLLIIGDIFLIPPAYWLISQINVGITSFQAIIFALAVFLALSALDIVKLLYHRERSKAFYFFFLLLLALFLSFITAFGIAWASNPMPIG